MYVMVFSVKNVETNYHLATGVRAFEIYDDGNTTISKAVIENITGLNLIIIFFILYYNNILNKSQQR